MKMKIRSLFSCLGQRISMANPCMNFIPGSTFMIRSRSEENLNKLNECMENMDEDVAKLFIQCPQTDFGKDPELLPLLNEYFNTSKQVSKICESLRKFLERAQHDECFLLDEALQDFEAEKLGYNGSILERSFRKTSKDLRNFNKHFNDSDLLEKVKICHEDLASMMVKLESTMKKIDKKLKRVRGTRVIIMTVMLAPVIAAVVVSQAVVGIFTSLPLEPLTTFATWRWKKSTETLKREKTAMTSMERGTMLVLKEVEKISRLVNRLEKVERSIRVKAEFAVKKAYPVAIAMSGMEEERKRMKLTLVDLDIETGRCDGYAQFGRSVARDTIVEFLSIT